MSLVYTFSYTPSSLWLLDMLIGLHCSLGLYSVSRYESENQMNPSNLGIVFGPTLLRPSEGPVNLNSLIDTAHQTRAVELLITHSTVSVQSIYMYVILYHRS